MGRLRGLKAFDEQKVCTYLGASTNPPMTVLEFITDYWARRVCFRFSFGHFSVMRPQSTWGGFGLPASRKLAKKRFFPPESGSCGLSLSRVYLGRGLRGLDF